MEFRIAATFTDALAKLPSQEQKAVKTSAFDLQTDPSSPGLQFHRIERSKDPHFWSVRVSRDIRIIVHKTEASMLLAYVDHHDGAYAWAERRRIEAHPRTGAIQIVEVRERVEEIAPRLPFPEWTPASPKPTSSPAAAASSKPIFSSLSRDDLLSIGAPEDWIADLQGATEDRFLELAPHLPSEAAEALLDYAATGSLPQLAVPAKPADPFAHPDALRRFRVVENVAELRQALDYPWDKWTVFLHPSQRALVDRDFAGPARVAGSAGTGKTVVALHRAVRLAHSEPDGRVLLTTFSEPLARALERKVAILTDVEPAIVPRITVSSFRAAANDLFQLALGQKPHIASDDQIKGALRKAAEANEAKDFSERFLRSEWSNVVDAWQISEADAYAEVPRLGRRNRIGQKQRDRLWPVFTAARQSLNQRGLFTWPQVFGAVAKQYADRTQKPFSHVVVDEAQDLGVPELRFLAAISATGPNALFFAGDLGQRIFQQPFSWKALGVDIRGRSSTLKVNYRTSHQIRQAADRLLPGSVRDVDGVEENRRGTISIFNGPAPELALVETVDAEIALAASAIRSALAEGLGPADVAIFVRSPEQVERARRAAAAAGVEALELSEIGSELNGRMAIGTMHLAKGLEFKAVIVMACDDEILPLQERIDAVADEVELEDVYETERQLLYVACTRARDRLLVTGVIPGSEFLADMQ